MYCAGTVNGVNIVGLALQNPSIPGLALPPPGMDTPFDTRGNLTFHTRCTNRQNNNICITFSSSVNFKKADLQNVK